MGRGGGSRVAVLIRTIGAMRQNPNSRRSRGRSGRKPGNSRNQILDSSGPGARVRGNSAQIYEKYQQLARDASSSGDRVAAEGFYQHAEHYFRLMEAAGLNREGNAQDQSQQRNGNAAQNVATAEPVEAPSEPTPEPASEPTPEGASGQTQIVDVANSEQPDQASSDATNGSRKSEEEARPARRARTRRPNGSAIGRSKPGKDAEAPASEDGSDTQSEDSEPVSA